MRPHTAQDPEVLGHYEGLVWKTASRLLPRLEVEMEDLQQLLRVKVWRALLSYDPSRSRMSQDAYVFSCVYNFTKDLLKRKRHNLLFIEDVAAPRIWAERVDVRGGARERFEGRYLSTDSEQVFAEVEDEPVVLPSTLSKDEREMVLLLYLDYSHREIAGEMSLRRRDVDAAVESIQAKMADWKPSAAQPARLAAVA